MEIYRKPAWGATVGPHLFEFRLAGGLPVKIGVSTQNTWSGSMGDIDFSPNLPTRHQENSRPRGVPVRRLKRAAKYAAYFYPGYGRSLPMLSVEIVKARLKAAPPVYRTESRVFRRSMSAMGMLSIDRASSFRRISRVLKRYFKRYTTEVSVSKGSGVGSPYISHDCPADSLRFAAIHFPIASCASFMRLYGPRWTATAASPAGVSVAYTSPVKVLHVQIEILLPVQREDLLHRGHRHRRVDGLPRLRSSNPL